MGKKNRQKVKENQKWVKCKWKQQILKNTKKKLRK